MAKIAKLRNIFENNFARIWQLKKIYTDIKFLSKNKKKSLKTKCKKNEKITTTGEAPIEEKKFLKVYKDKVIYNQVIYKNN